ncbi:protein ELYS-like [Spea bombifrons]|uniref:protein ELYS-like n=1 Tax=Spea bombifrons TaxID=233779 RepID=UPI00234C0021|nr:protein ELYS-like [Spea bombifrons]
MEVFEPRDFMAVEEPSVPALSHSVEVHLLQEKDVEIQVAEREHEVINYQELYPAAPIEVAYEDNMVHKYNSELTECTDSAEHELDDAEGEHFAEQNNFTLVLEGDGGDEDAEDMQPCNEDRVEPLTVEEHTYVTSALSKYVDICEPNHGVEVSFGGTEQGTSVMEEIPYVPENVTVAITENLIAVIKDTESKNFTEESNSQKETKEDEYLQASSKTPVKVMKLAIPEDKQMGEPTTLKELDELNDGRSSPGLQTVLKPPTPRRSIRKSSRFTESTNVDSGELSLPTTPRRGKKAKENIENQNNVYSTLQEEEMPISIRITRKTKNTVSEKNESTVMVETTAEESLPRQPSTPTRTRRGKLTAQEEQENMDTDLDQKAAMPQTPTRITRSRNIVLEKITSSQKEETDEPEPLATTPTRGRRGKRVVNELVKHFELNASQPDSKPSTSPPASPKKVSMRWARNKFENKTTEEESVKVAEQTSDTPRKKPRKSTINKSNVEEVTGVSEECIADGGQDSLVTVDSTKKANATINVRRGRKSVLPPVSEESLEERLQLPESQDKPGDEKDLTRITRTRSSNVLPHPDEFTVNFEFSTPTTKQKKKTKAQQAALPVSPEEMVAHTSSQFVFSPPSTRTRRATRSSVAGPVKNEDVKPQEPQETQDVPVEPVIRRPKGRPPKHKKKESTSKEPTWSPPPVEIQLLSPPESPAGDVADTKTVPVETKAEKNTLRRNRRRIMSKPVTRRKLR